MKKLLEQVKEFHECFGHPVMQKPTMAPTPRANLRVSLIREELWELAEAIERRDLVEIADALGDLAYVVAGAALEFGIPLDRVCDEIHRSNMSKLGGDGRPVTREDGKTMKGPNYSPPDLVTILTWPS